MNPENVYASNYARKGLIQGSSIFMRLTSLMCWDAVKQCAVGAGIITAEKGRLLESRLSLVSSSDFQISNAYQLKTLEQGNVLGFFTQKGASVEIMHCMISLGGSIAAGNKNDCIGIGNSVGWESIDLSHLQWNQDGTFYSAMGIGYDGNAPTFRNIDMHYRPISYLKYK